MDTKSKKFKYSPFAKFMCLFLSAVCIFVSGYCAFSFVQASMLFGFEKFLNNSYVHDYYATDDFNNHISHDLYKVTALASEDCVTLEEQISMQSNEKVTQAVNAYLDYKAEIIRAELEYAVDNYDDSYFNYEYSADLVDIPETTRPNSSAEPVTEPEDYTNDINENIPRNIEAAKKVLETVSGRDFINYEALVRDSAFDTDFSYSFDVVYYDMYNNYISSNHYFSVGNLLYSESQIKSEFSAQFNTIRQQIGDEYHNNFFDYEYELSRLENLKYYVVNHNDAVYTNLDEKPVVEDIKKQPLYAVYYAKHLEINGFKDSNTLKAVSMNIEDSASKELYVYIDSEVSKGTTNDIYSDMYGAFLTYSYYDATTLIFVFTFSLITAIILLVVFLCKCGHVNKYDYPVLARIDAIPTDIHLIFSAGIISLIATGLYFFLDNTLFDYFNTYKLFFLSACAVSAVVTVIWLIFSEWLSSTVRIKKCSESFFRRMLIVKFVRWIARGIKNIINRISKEFKYRPKKMQKVTILVIFGYVIINLLILILGSLGIFIFYEGIIGLICIAVHITFNTLVAIFLMKYVRMFDSVISASCEQKNVDFGNEKVPEELRLLSENLTNSNVRLDAAIEQAIRDEQMKTELITNVSHDLKTPLTSLITYSDLLSKCDISDENAVKYTNVINEQSGKLKRLIEDLIEASKVSTGNVTLSKSILNLSELAMQAIVEFNPEIEKNGNEIRFVPPENPPKVFADGNKTYRIIANLLSNARKYSAPSTRIYVSVYSDSINGYFEIKNISSEPLNISPDELTERFVRGDKSRSRDGNGLGLSIAKDLCILQGGELKIVIDGDLFKAIVKLPCETDENPDISRNKSE